MINCGAESTDYDGTFLLQRATLNIVGGNYHTPFIIPDTETYKNAVFSIYGSNIFVFGCNFGSGNIVSPVPFIRDTGMESDIISNITMCDCHYEATWRDTETFVDGRLYIYVSKKGNTDIYCKTILNCGTINYTTNLSGVITIPGTFRWGGTFNVYLTAKDSISAAAIASGYYISNDVYNNLQITFITPPNSDCMFNYSVNDGLPL